MMLVLSRRHLRPSADKVSLYQQYTAAFNAGLACSAPLVQSEMARRRQAGRLIRSCLMPVLVVLWMQWNQPNWGPSTVLKWALGAYVVVLILYAYAELTIFSEGKRAQAIERAD